LKVHGLCIFGKDCEQGGLDRADPNIKFLDEYSVIEHDAVCHRGKHYEMLFSKEST